MFKDENLYKAIKQQLTGGQIENEYIDSYDEEGETLYKAAYDKDLVLVIEKDILNNEIEVLFLANNQIEDLTGIEYFRALERLKLNRNYIEDVTKILELQNGKIQLREEIIEKLENLKTEISVLNNKIEGIDKEKEDNEKSKTAKYDSISQIIVEYIRTNNANNIADGTVKNIQDTVKTITKESIDDEGNCAIITGITNASGVYSNNGEKLRAELLELRTLLGKPEELDEQKSDIKDQIIEKIEEFESTYSKVAELIRIISDETMNIDFNKIDLNNLTTTEKSKNNKSSRATAKKTNKTKHSDYTRFIALGASCLFLILLIILVVKGFNKDNKPIETVEFITNNISTELTFLVLFISLSV